MLSSYVLIGLYSTYTFLSIVVCFPSVRPKHFQYGPWTKSLALALTHAALTASAYSP